MASTFWPLLVTILPLYAMIGAGFVAGRWLRVSRRPISTLVIYMVAPVTFFGFIARADLTAAAIPLTITTFVLASSAALMMYAAGGWLFSGAARNLAAQAACTANTGYFGVPVFLALFPADQLGMYMLGMVGVSVAEATVGFYLLARGRYTWQDSVKRLLRLPLIYAALLGLVVNICGIPGHPVLAETLERVKGAYVVLGMMMVGFGLAGVKSLVLDWAFIGVLLLQKLLLWPLLAAALIVVDGVTFGLLDTISRQSLLLLSFMPLAANTVAFATQLRIYPEKAATAVLISSLVGLVSVPLCVALFL